MKKIYTLCVLAFVLFISVNYAKATVYTFNVTSTRTLTVARAGNNCNSISNSCTFYISGGTTAANVYLQLNEDCTNCTFASANSYSQAILTSNITLAASPVVGGTSLIGAYLVVPNGYTLTLGANINIFAGTFPFNTNLASRIIVGNNNANTATAEMNLNGSSIVIFDAASVIYLGTTLSLIDDQTVSKEGTVLYFYGLKYLYSANNHAGNPSPAPAPPYNMIGVSNYTLSGLGQSVIKTTAPTQFNFTTVGVTPLPIVLVDFNASLNSDNTVGLTWTTEQEENSNYFNIERSADGESWESLGTVPAQGNSSVATNYSFTDRTLLGVINYYRLQAFDLDGKYSYSEVRIVRTTATTSLSIFPNPAKSYVNIFFGKTTTEDLTIKLINANGQVVQSKLVSTGGSNISLPVSTYPTGVYMLHISGASGSVQTTKVFITRE